MENWDKVETCILVGLGLSWEHARIAVSRIAEHRQSEDREGYIRGYNCGYASAVLKYEVTDKKEKSCK